MKTIKREPQIAMHGVGLAFEQDRIEVMKFSLRSKDWESSGVTVASLGVGEWLQIAKIALEHATALQAQ